MPMPAAGRAAGWYLCTRPQQLLHMLPLVVFAMTDTQCDRCAACEAVFAGTDSSSLLVRLAPAGWRFLVRADGMMLCFSAVFGCAVVGMLQGLFQACPSWILLPHANLLESLQCECAW